MSTNPPDSGPLARPKLDSLLDAICQEIGLDSRGAQLIKFTSNAVFRLATVPVVVRIAGSNAVRARVPKVINVARWLAEHELPAVRLLSDVDQPVAVDGHLATLWHAVEAVPPRPTAGDLGAILCRFHAIPSPRFDLPRWRPASPIRERLAEADGVNADDVAFLKGLCDDIEAALGDITYMLPMGPIHGDATVANLLHGTAGTVVCDFDSTSVGPPEWDLVPVATGMYRFDPTGRYHEQLAASYGLDITAWSGFQTLRRLRELQLVTSVLPVLTSSPGLYAQWRHRLRTLRANDSDARWEPYR